MKMHRSIRVENSDIGGSVLNTGTIINHVTNIRQTGRSKRPSEYPAGSIGSNLSKRNYIKYLVERYHQFREADASFGRFTGKFSYAVIFKNIERGFKAPTYFIPESRFDELVAYLQRKASGTIVGKRNRARGIPNYASYEEFLIEQAGDGNAKGA